MQVSALDQHDQPLEVAVDEDGLQEPEDGVRVYLLVSRRREPDHLRDSELGPGAGVAIGREVVVFRFAYRLAVVVDSLEGQRERVRVEALVHRNGEHFCLTGHQMVPLTASSASFSFFSRYGAMLLPG
jgi:hypothetical protein